MTKTILDPAAVHRRHCHFSGRVQGVGFRYTARNIALRHNVTGFVRNLSDGRVELVLEGPSEEIQSVVDTVKERMNGFVHHTDETEFPPTGEFPHFYIRHC